MIELLKIQSELKAPKGQYNSFGKYKYRSAEDILEAVKPLLKEHKCHLTLSDEMVLVGERYYIKATATLSTEEKNVSTTAYARESESKKGMDESQITGTASSYARKYALNGLFAIDDTKDADTDEYTAKTRQTENNTSDKKATDKQVDLIRAVLKTDEQIAWLQQVYGTTEPQDLSIQQASELISKINKKKER